MRLPMPRIEQASNRNLCLLGDMNSHAYTVSLVLYRECACFSVRISAMYGTIISSFTKSRHAYSPSSPAAFHERTRCKNSTPKTCRLHGKQYGSPMLVVAEHVGHCAQTSFFLNPLLFICCLYIFSNLWSLRLFGFVSICTSGVSQCVIDADELHRPCSAPLNPISYKLEGELEKDLEGELETDLEGEHVSKPVSGLDSKLERDLERDLEAELRVVLNSESDQESVAVLSTDVPIEAMLIYLEYSCTYLIMICVG